MSALENSAYTPSRWGEVYHALPHDEALGAGAAGVGKTLVLLMEPFQQISLEHDRCAKRIDHPFPLHWGESKGWALHLRRTFKELGQTIAHSKDLFPKIDPGAKFVKDSEEMSLGWVFSSGYHYQFGHCMDPDDWMNYQSHQFSIICFDELVTFLEEQYDGITTRLRSADPVLGNPKHRLLKVRSMSNPVVIRQQGDNYTVRNPHWVRDRFVAPAPQGRVTLKRKLTRLDGRVETVSMIYLPGKLSDNPNEMFRDQYELKLLSQKPYMRKAMLEGDWYATPGAYFADEWDPSIHISAPFKIPAHWKRFRAMDWGHKQRGVIGWFAMDEDGNLVMEKELSFRLKDAREVARDVREIERGMGLWKHGESTLTGPADTQLWEHRGDVGRCKADVFADEGVQWTKADKRSRRRNAERISERLRDHEGPGSVPGFVVFHTCRMMLQNLPSIQADRTDPETPADGGEDHDLDMLGYACAYASHGRAGIAYMTEDDIDDAEDLGEEDFKPGGYAYG